MSNPTTLAAPTRRLLAGLIVTTTATVSAGAWALAEAGTDPTDEPTTTTTTPPPPSRTRPSVDRPPWRRRWCPPPLGRSSSPTPTTASDSRSAETAPTRSSSPTPTTASASSCAHQQARPDRRRDTHRSPPLKLPPTRQRPTTPTTAPTSHRCDDAPPIASGFGVSLSPAHRYGDPSSPHDVLRRPRRWRMNAR